MTHTESFLTEVKRICENISCDSIEGMIDELIALRARKGRLFLIGVGGSAGNCSHAVNDFRKLCGIEAYSAADNISELTARANDEGWDTIFTGWLEASNLNSLDAILIFSVGGGDIERQAVESYDLRLRSLLVLGLAARRGHAESAPRGERRCRRVNLAQVARADDRATHRRGPRWDRGWRRRTRDTGRRKSRRRG